MGVRAVRAHIHLIRATRRRIIIHINDIANLKDYEFTRSIHSFLNCVGMCVGYTRYTAR